jgi:hypothetical protein
MLHTLRIGFDWTAAWELARSSLQYEGMTFARLRQLQQAWTELEIALLASGDQQELQSLVEAAKSPVKRVPEQGRARVLDWLDSAMSEFRRENSEGFTDRKPAFVEAALLLAILQPE